MLRENLTSLVRDVRGGAPKVLEMVKKLRQKRGQHLNVRLEYQDDEWVLIEEETCHSSAASIASQS